MKEILESFDTVYANSRRFRYDLSVNINPLGPSRKALDIGKEFSEFSAYPVASYEILQETISKRLSVSFDNIVLGAGLDGLLHNFILQFLQKGQKLLMPAVTFQNPSFSARQAGGIIERVPMSSNLQVDLCGLQKRLSSQVGVVFLCNPNNPTGLLESPYALLEIINATKALVIIDEANIEYSNGQSCVQFLESCPNLVVMRSLSKAYGLAGMRIGFAMASSSIQSKIRQGNPPFNVSSLACEMARAAILDTEHLESSLRYIRQEKEFLANALLSFGFELVPSDSNTLFVKLPDERKMKVPEFINQLNTYDCHVVDGAHFGLDQRFFRIAPRTREINKKFIEIIKTIS